MNKQTITLKLLGIAAMMTSASMPLIAGVITFHPESGVFAGSGCSDSSSRMYVDEYGDLVMEHDDMRLDLPAYGSDSSLAGRRACAIRVPVTIPRGFYVKTIEQNLIFSAKKSASTDAALSTRTAILEPISTFTIRLPRHDEYHGEMRLEARRDDLNHADQIARYCRTDRSEELMLQVNLAITGRRDSSAENLLVQAVGGYLGEGLEIEVAACP
jgi:hypothetical protein